MQKVNYPNLNVSLLRDQTAEIVLFWFAQTLCIFAYLRARACEDFSLTQNWRVLYFGFAEVKENQPEYIADHQAGNDAWSLPRGTCRANYGGNRFLRFSGISKKQFSDFSWRSAVEENWRTSAANQRCFIQAAATQRNSSEYFTDFSYLRAVKLYVSAHHQRTYDSASIGFALCKPKYYHTVSSFTKQLIVYSKCNSIT